MSASNKILDNIPSSLIIIFIFFSGITYYQGLYNASELDNLESKVQNELLTAAESLHTEIKELEKLRVAFEAKLYAEGRQRDTGIAELNEKFGRVEERLKTVEKWCKELLDQMRRNKND